MPHLCIAIRHTMVYNDGGRTVSVMAIKSANVVARVEPDVKEKAEAIFDTLGIPASTAINMFYRQVILWDGMPFRPSIPSHRPLAGDEMTKEEFDRRMAIGLTQAKEDESAPSYEVFERLIGEIRCE